MLTDRSVFFKRLVALKGWGWYYSNSLILSAELSKWHKNNSVFITRNRKGGKLVIDLQVP